MLGDSEGGCDLGAGEQFDNVAGEAGEVTILESEGTTLTSGGGIG